MVVAFSAGGTLDTLARIIAQKLGDAWGQSVVIENRPGAGGNIGAAAAAQAAPDGYTLHFGAQSLAVNVTIAPHKGFDPLKDFDPVVLVATAQDVLMVPANSPFKTVRELIDYAKGHPGQLDYASAGQGSSGHLATVMFSELAGIKLQHVPYASQPSNDRGWASGVEPGHDEKDEGGFSMFDSLSEKLSGILDRLTRRGALTDADVDAALREVRRALIEADVALDVARAFVDGVRARAVGVEVIKSVTPGQMVVKIVHDQLIETLGSDSQSIDLNAPAPVPIMLIGLQGSGKTTTAAKLAKRLTETAKRKVLMASLDVRRPAAMEQLAVLGRQVAVDTLPIVEGQMPVQIARRALEAGRPGGYDVVILDTAGRITLDEAMMAEAADVKRAASPHEVLLVADALTGQDAVNLARSFNERVGLTGIVLTRIDGDGRGGAALSMRTVTGK